MKGVCVLLLAFLIAPSELAIATTLANGFVTTNSNVDDFANMAKDLLDMKGYCDDNQINQTKTIYEEGRNSYYGYKEGLRSLQKFSTENDDDFSLVWAFQMYGLTYGSESFDPQNVGSNFADDFVMKSFEVANNCHHAWEASRAMNLWMHTAYTLWDSMNRLNTCESSASCADNLDEKADQFIALWIGSEQEMPDDENGYGLWSMTHEVAVKFDTIDVHGVAKVNSNIKRLYEKLFLELSFVHEGTAKDVWVLINMISSQMMVPLLQLLIESMYTNDQDRIDIYASMVVPQLSQCRKSTYDRLVRLLLETPYEKDDYHFIKDQLYNSLECFQLTCEDIGIYDTDGRVCIQSNLAKLANYSPDINVREQADIDLDLHQMEIILSFGSDRLWDMGRNIYSYGKNSIILPETGELDEPLEELDRMSFQRMASSSDIEKSEYYDVFKEYHGNQFFAHDSIMSAFNYNGKWKGETFPLSTEQRAGFILTTIESSVTWMYISAKLEEAVMECNLAVGENHLSAGTPDAWDEAAAYIIGSLEGTEKGGSSDFDDGTLLWSLSNQRGREFDRLNADEGYALINEIVMTLLLSGKGEIQSVLKYAILNHNLDISSPRVSVFEGEAYANAILPVIDSMDHHTAKKIKLNMVVNTASSNEKLVQDGPQKVADLYLRVLPKFLVECEYIGKSSGVDACLNYDPLLETDGRDEESSGNRDALRRIFHTMILTGLMACSYVL